MNQIIDKIIHNMGKVIIGKRFTMEQILIAYLCEGHVLLEGDPGVGKTRLALALAKSVEGDFHRVQFTPDILPSDITGYCVFNKEDNELEYKQGAVFCNILLADEINRASPRVQSSLLEAMEERQVTVEGKVRKLPQPFMVVATQNAIEQQGTYPLPEAQLDRFFMKLIVGYPSRLEWEKILDQSETNDALKELESVATLEELILLKKTLEQVEVSKAVKNYIIDIAEAIRRNEMIQTGISPRGTIALLQASKGCALLNGRSYVLPDDVQQMVLPVLGHRIVLAGHSQWNNMRVESFIRNIIQSVQVPV